MEYFWQQLLAIILAPTLVVGSIAYLMKSFFNQGLKRDLEKFKIDLERESFEKRQRFSLIHHKRAEVVTGVYSRLVKAIGLVRGLVAPIQPHGQSLKSKRQIVFESITELVEYFFQNRIVLPTATAQKLEQLINVLSDSIIDFNVSQSGNDEYMADVSGYWLKAYKTIRDDAPPILNVLEKEFKDLLGFIETSISLEPPHQRSNHEATNSDNTCD